ncbi:MAG: acyltransferase family protein [Candidatus Lindowbacteria bacterium]|nr:acyltransferase family protein [Candidatus Lindowbacteria bacterium]
MEKRNERRYDVDWLRVLAVLLLVPFHAGVIFCPGDSISYVKGQPSLGINLFVDFVHRWHMPLFFFVSGAATWFSLGSRSAGRYLNERVKRLLVPLIFGTLAIIPVQVYWMRLSNHEFSGSYLRFYPEFFNGIAPNGNFEWGHLWFLAYLFVFSLVALPLFLFLRSEAGRHHIEKLAACCEKNGGVFLLAVPLALIQAALRAKWPGFQNLYNDWANFFFYLTFFVYGYLLCSHEGFTRAVDKHGGTALAVAIVLQSTILLLEVTNNNPARGYSLGWILFMVLHGFNSWMWLLAILSLGSRYLRFTNRPLEYANEGALPFYILHMAVVVSFGYYFVQWNASPVTQFFAICAAALPTTAVLYDVLAKRTSVTRLLFGMKAGAREKRAPAQAAMSIGS